MFWIVHMTFKFAGSSIHCMKAITCSADPEISFTVFEDGSYFIINKTVWIIWIMFVTGKCTPGSIHFIQPTFGRVVLLGTIYGPCPYPNVTLAIFIDRSYRIVADACFIKRNIPEMSEFIRFRIKPVEAI